MFDLDSAAHLGHYPTSGAFIANILNRHSKEPWNTSVVVYFDRRGKGEYERRGKGEYQVVIPGKGVWFELDSSDEILAWHKAIYCGDKDAILPFFDWLLEHPDVSPQFSDALNALIGEVNSATP